MEMIGIRNETCELDDAFLHKKLSSDPETQLK